MLIVGVKGLLTLNAFIPENILFNGPLRRNASGLAVRIYT